MKCEQIQPILLDYSRGTLSISEKAEIREHLKTCVDCSAVLQDEIALDAMFRSVPTAEPTAGIWSIVESHISSSKPSIMDRLRIMSRMRLFRTTGAIAVTAALLLVITFQFRPEQRTANNVVISKDSVAVANVSVKWTDDPTGDSSDAMAKYIEGL